jgi:thiol-disulfide isomerase/thioredoxin
MRKIAKAAALLAVFAMAAAGLTTRHEAYGQGRAAAQGLRELDAAGLKQYLNSRKGRVVVVNLWATWCAPCKAEFPYLVRLHNAYRARGVEVATISIDNPDKKAEAQAFLRQQKARTTNFIVKAEGLEAMANALDPQWPGAVPYTVIYDRKGRVSDKLLGAHSYAQFEAAVRRALAR